MNVVDEIMFHFLVVKDPLDQYEWFRIQRVKLEEPSYATEKRRYLESVMAGVAWDEESEERTKELTEDRGGGSTRGTGSGFT